MYRLFAHEVMVSGALLRVNGRLTTSLIFIRSASASMLRSTRYPSQKRTLCS